MVRSFFELKEELDSPNDFNIKQSHALKLYLGSEYVGELEHFSKSHLQQKSNIEKIVGWRNANREFFISNVETNFEKSELWFRSTLDNPKKIMFWIKNSDGDFVGHIGLAFYDATNLIELDSVLRGEPAHESLMKLAVIKVEHLASSELKVKQLFLRVLNSNLRAKKFYLKLGYELDHAMNYLFNESKYSQESNPSESSIEFMSKNLHVLTQD